MKRLLLALSLLLLSANSIDAKDNKGTRELGLDIGLEKGFHSGDVSQNRVEYSYPVKIRIGFFFSERLELETRFAYDYFSDDIKISGTLGLTHNFEKPDRNTVPFVGLFTMLSRRDAGPNDLEQFGVGVTLGVKSIEKSPARRLEVFLLRRFDNQSFASEYMLGANIGLSYFFKSTSLWDK